MPVVQNRWYRWPLVLALSLFLPVPAQAQIPGLNVPQESPLPPGVKRDGLLETTYVEFEGVPLFEIASPVVYDREKPEKLIPVEVRARQIESALLEFRTALMEADRGAKDKRSPLESGAYTIDIETVNGETLLTAHGKGQSPSKHLATVTKPDAKRKEMTPENLAVEWRTSISQALSRAVISQRPESVKSRFVIIRKIGIGLAVVHLLFFFINRWLLRWQNSLREALARSREADNSPPPEDEGNVSPAIMGERKKGPFQSLRRLSIQEQFQFLALMRWLLFWILFFLWIGTTGLSLELFPQTRKFAIYWTATPFMVLIAFFFAGLINRIADLLVDRFVVNWRENRLFDGADAAHVEARITTISGVIRALKAVLVYSIAIGWVLSSLQVVPWSILTIGAMIALAVSFAIQSLIKDVVMGMLILLEDQFALGDYVSIENTTGTVEYMNLRITRIRAQDGRLITLPNNLITRVENLSRGWSLISIEFDVPSTANADMVLEFTRRIAGEMAEEAEWKNIITNPIQWSGVQKITRSSLTMTIAVQTLPLHHWEAGRELRRRIKNALDQEGLDWSLSAVVTSN